MDKDMFKERERSLEEEYFRKHEAKLIEKLRERGRLEEIAEQLAIKLQIDDPALLRRIMALGVTLDTGAAFLLAPLLRCLGRGRGDGSRARDDSGHPRRPGHREDVARLRPARGVALRQRPADEIFDAAVEAIKIGLSVLTPEERADRIKRIVDACRQVAAASGGLGRLLGLGSGVSSEEESLLDAISAQRSEPDDVEGHHPARGRRRARPSAQRVPGGGADIPAGASCQWSFGTTWLVKTTELGMITSSFLIVRRCVTWSRISTTSPTTSLIFTRSPTLNVRR